jgi:hypothetical protein
MTTSVVPFGKTWKELSNSALFKHKLFLRALMFSPSYQLAHLLRTGRKDLVDQYSLPADFDKVLEAYDQIGNIFDISFEEWWKTKGVNLFQRKAPSQRLVINVNLSNSRQEIHQKIDALLDQALELKKLNERSELLKFEINKIRGKTIHDRLDLVWIKSIINPIDDSGKSIPAFQWKLPFFLKGYITGDFESIFFGPDFNVKSKKIDRNKKSRKYLSMLVSKNLKEALNICENAARRKFPSNELSGSNLTFNYPWIMSANNEMAEHKAAYKKLHPDKEEFDITRKEFRKIHKKTLRRIKEKNSFS